MMTRKSIDNILLSVGTEKLTQREWDWIKHLKSMDPSSQDVAMSIIQHRGDSLAENRLREIIK